ncbi:LysR substrate-binding domain-containing protein [Ancylobacter dichloromethanicus]
MRAPTTFAGTASHRVSKRSRPLPAPQRPEFRRLLQGALAQGSSLPTFHIAADSFTFVRELVRMGHGVGLLPKSLCREDLASGTVAPVLADHFFRIDPAASHLPVTCRSESEGSGVRTPDRAAYRQAVGAPNWLE